MALALTILALVTACVNDPVSTVPSNNAGIHVDELFTHDGCTVYRFRDGSYHYYVRCKGEPGKGVPETTTLSCIGKGCKDDDSIPTFPTQL
jgi:hypothetical protein